jgi:hypothetical protein
MPTIIIADKHLVVCECEKFRKLLVLNDFLSKCSDTPSTKRNFLIYGTMTPTQTIVEFSQLMIYGSMCEVV